MSFDWQTEEDSDWDDQQWQEQPETAEPPKRPWRTVLLIVVLLAVAGGIVYQQLTQRIDDAAVAVETDIFATHNLLNRAASTQDGDLGKAVLSGRDMGWSRAYSSLLDADLFYQNPVLGITLANPEAAYTPLSRDDDRFVSLEVDPALSGAELQYGLEYLAVTEDGVASVVLQRTAVYRRGETRWLLSPPTDAFWGTWDTEEMDTITLNYLLRDEEIALQLATDLDDLLASACAELPDLVCDRPIQLRLDNDPESLLTVADPANLYDGNLRFNLPTPSLVGLPINDAGYQALLHAYATQIMSGLIAVSVDYDCCQRAPMFQALVDYQLAALGLIPWPVTQQTQQELSVMGVHIELIFPYWSSSDFAAVNDETSVQLYGFVDFMLNDYVPQMSALTLMRSMNEGRAYQSWLASLEDTPEGQSFGNMDRISRDWWFYAITQGEISAVSEQPIPLPAQDLQIGCLADNFYDDIPLSSLNRYELASGSWIEEASFSGLSFFNPLPQDNGVILQLIDTSSDAPGWRTLWWRDGAGVEILDTEALYSISLGQMDPQGQYLVTYFFSQEDEEFLPMPQLIDVASCEGGNCATTEILENPHWSPNGEGLLLSTGEMLSNSQYFVDGRIMTFSPDALNTTADIYFRYQTDSPETAVRIGEGIAPFWLNDQQFGFIHTNFDAAQAPSQELVTASIADLTPVTVLAAEQLTAALPDGADNRLLQMRYALTHPTNENILIVMGLGQSDEVYLFQVDLAADTVELLFDLDNSRGEHTIGFSPDGRFLAATGALHLETTTFNQQDYFGALFLYDFAESDLQTLLVNTDVFLPAYTFDWSRDGNWLAVSRDTGMLSLVAPAYDYQQSIPHEAGVCTSLAWVNP